MRLKDIKTDGKKSERISQKIRHSQDLRRTFLIIMFGILITILFIFTVVSSITRKMIAEQNREFAELELEKIQNEFDAWNRQANRIATQILLDDVCSDFLFLTDEMRMSTIEQLRFQRKLKNYQYTNDYVECIYMYNGRIDQFITSGSAVDYAGKDEFWDQEIVRILEDSEQTDSRNLFKRKVASQKGGEADTEIYTCILKNMQGESVDNAIIVNLNLQQAFRNLIGEKALQDSYVLVINKQEESVVETGVLSELFGTRLGELKENIKGKGKTEPSYTEMTFQGEKYFAIWTHSEETEFDYIKITKWDTVFYAEKQLQKYVIFACILIVLTGVVGILADTVLINHLYNQMPEKRAEKNRMKISEKIQLKENFLNEFFYKIKLYGKKQLCEKFAEHGMEITENQLFSVWILQLEKYFGFVEEFGEQGTYDIKYGFRNIFEEIFSKDFIIEGIINQNNTLTFLASSRTEGIVEQERIKDRFAEFCESVKPFVTWTFTLIGSRENVTIEKIPGMVEELYGVRKESFFYPSNMFLTCEQLREEHKESVNYQNLDVKRFIKSLREEGNPLEEYQTLATALENSSSNDYMNAMLWLGVSVVRDLKEVSVLEVQFEDKLNHFLTNLTKCEKKTEMDELFYQLFEETIQMRDKISQKKGAVGKVEEVLLYIQKNYKDPNLNLEYLGMEFAASPNYLGRVFRKETGFSVAEYLNKERMKYVLEELEKTDKPVKDIAEESGFANSNYFYTYFRRKMGMTPMAYREQIQSRINTDASRDSQ